MDIVLILGGFIGLLLGGEALVKGAVSIATRFGVSPLVIGLTLVGFGTSTPELVTSVQAAWVGSPGIAVGNVVGSNIANILLIIGLTAFIRPLVVAQNSFPRDAGLLCAVTALCIVLLMSGTLSRLNGIVFLAGLLIYLVYVLRAGKLDPTLVEEVPSTPAQSLLLASAYLVGGLIITIFAAKFLVMGAVSLAASLGMSQAVIGLTVVAVGTSLPELVTSLVAARRGQTDMALGNIIGSNIFNVLGILGVTAVVLPLEVPASIVSFDLWVMAAATLALVIFGRTAAQISRIEGALLLSAYAIYLVWLVSQIG
jgi:cation:H+ antiporter